MIGDAFKRSALTVELVDEDFDPLGLIDGRERPTRPLVFRHALGSRPCDLIRATHVAIDLISDRTYQLLIEESITGWQTYSVEIYGAHGERVEGYRGLSITGRCGMIDNSRSPRVLRPPRVPNAKPYLAWMGLYFDPATWDSSDLFLPMGTAAVFGVERVKLAFERAMLTNFDFGPLPGIERIMLA